MKNNKKADPFDLKINRKFLKQLTCIDEGSKDGIYAMVLDSELRSMLSAPRTSSKEDLDAVTKSAMWKCLRENTAFSGGEVPGLDIEIVLVQGLASRLMILLLVLKNTYINALQKHSNSTRGHGYCQEGIHQI